MIMGGTYMEYKDDVEQIKNYINSLMTGYGFRGPLHFTDFTNLKSIFESGFLNSREFCNNNNINFTDVADKEIIDHTMMDVKQCVRFYYKEKTPTLYRNEGIKLNCEKPHVPIPVYLLFDNELLYLDNTVYSDGNAKSRFTTFGDDYDFFASMDWRWIFDRDPIYAEDGPEKWEIKRKRQAELLSLDPVPLNYIRKIIFRCSADEKRAINLFGYDDKYCINGSMFHNLHNYIYDYRISFRNNLSEVVFDIDFFNNNWDQYQFSYEALGSNNIVDADGNEEYYIIDNKNLIIEGTQYRKKAKFILKNYSSKWKKVNIYMNGVVCIEENFEDMKIINKIINNYTVKADANNMLTLETTFQFDIFRKYKHSYKILDINNNSLSHGVIDFPKDQEGLSWITKFNGYHGNWYKVQYLINDILCIDEIIKK